MTEQQNSNFANLLTVWRRHDDNRRSGASISELADARHDLDQARYTTWAWMR